MQRLTLAVVVAGILAAGGANVHAQSPELFAEGPDRLVSPASTVPEAAFFVGLGGSYSLADFVNQNVYGQGVSNVFRNGALVAAGAAGGSTKLDFDAASRLAPLAQLGFFQHFAGSNWLWGTKFSYSYVGATATHPNVLIPQAGGFTGIQTSSFKGNEVVRAYEVSINDQFVLTPFLGRSFEKCFLYFGGGPSISRTETELKNLIGFADINGMTTDISGAPTSFSSSKWLWGGAAVVGVNYFFNSSWFLDFSYTFSATNTPSSNFSAPFTGSNPRFSTAGIVSGNYSGTVLKHSIAISINRAF